MQRYLSVLLVAICCSVVVDTLAQKQARVPATPHPIEFVQPNGDTIQIRLFGDERRHYHSDMEGNIIIKNKKGYFCYGKIGCGQMVVPSTIVVSSPQKKTNKEKEYIKTIAKERRLRVLDFYNAQ